jgi:hypothetical protein
MSVRDGVVRRWEWEGREFVVVEQGDDDNTTEVCITSCLLGSGNIELMGGRSSDVRWLGRAEVCLREDEDVG